MPGGLLKHLALVEDDYFSEKLWGRGYAPVWRDADFESDRDWDWNSAADDTPEQLYGLWQAAVVRSRAAVREAIADGGLDRPAAFTWPDGSTPSLRRLMVDMLEEYTRHTGHADLLREAVDGRVGEDAPEDFTVR